MSTPDFHFFYGGEFSQWFVREFEDDGLIFNHCEKYMMYHKAVLFRDNRSAREILKMVTPKQCKDAGRLVSGFNQQKWNAEARRIVYRGNRAKFTQHLDLKLKLIGTKGRLVEASPSDRIWGCGFGLNDPHRLDPSKWTGTNWLGDVLTELRDRIICEQRISKAAS